MVDKTVIYYSSNRENPKFEKKVTDNILKVCNLPIVSVTQKPLVFGKNICVGDVGSSYLNAFRQCLIACENCSTKYVVMTEADCLYPETGYFDFEPSDENVIYNYDNVWIFWTPDSKYGQIGKRDLRFYKKRQTHASLIFGREFLINLLRTSLKGLPEWSRTKVDFPYFTPEHKFVNFTGLPIISVKTDSAVNPGTGLDKIAPVESLDYWGTGKDIIRGFLNE